MKQLPAKLRRYSRRTMLAFMLVLTLLGALLPGAALAAPQGSVASSNVESPIESRGWGCDTYYTVRYGDTLSGIAARHGTTTQAIMQANGIWNPNHIFAGQVLYIPCGYNPHPQPQPQPQPQPWPIDCAICHVVRHGETLSQIAQWYGVSPAAIAQANGIWNWNHIYAGQKLCIPGGWNPDPWPPTPSCGQYYTVQRGDNLTQIARRCGTTVNNLVSLNGIWNPSRIYVGQVLRIW